MGRPTKCTPALTGKVKRLLEEGAYPETVLSLLGVSQDSHRRWMKQGEADMAAGEETTFAAYAAAVDEGIAAPRYTLHSMSEPLVAYGPVGASFYDLLALHKGTC